MDIITTPCVICHRGIWDHAADCEMDLAVHPMVSWVSVVTDDDQTRIWSGPADKAQPWLDSDQGRSMARALAHDGITMVIQDDGDRGMDRRYLTTTAAQAKYVSDHGLTELSQDELARVVPEYPEGTKEYADYRAKLTEALEELEA